MPAGEVFKVRQTNLVVMLHIPRHRFLPVPHRRRSRLYRLCSRVRALLADRGGVQVVAVVTVVFCVLDHLDTVAAAAAA